MKKQNMQIRDAHMYQGKKINILVPTEILIVTLILLQMLCPL